MIGKAARGWSRFWFEADGRAQTRAFRAGFGLLLFVVYAVRSLDLELFYGEQGIVTLGAVADLMPQDYRFSLLSYFTSRAALWALNSVFLVSLLAMGLGFLPRVAAAAALVLHVSFLHRNIGIVYGVDLIASFFFLFLLFADDREGLAYRKGDTRAILGSMVYRLSQIQVCIIYGYSGLKKLKGASWWAGEGLWYALANVELARFDFTWLAGFPFVVAAMTFTTLVWEIYFPALVWIKPVRLPLLGLGVLLHLGIAVGLGLPFFAGLMVLTYFFFLDAALIAEGKAFLTSLFRKVRPAVSE